MHTSVAPAESKDTRRNRLLLPYHPWIGIQKDIKFVQETAGVKSSVFTDHFRLETVTKNEKLEHLD